jgi:hypothetical protein
VPLLAAGVSSDQIRAAPPVPGSPSSTGSNEPSLASSRGFNRWIEA